MFPTTSKDKFVLASLVFLALVIFFVLAAAPTQDTPLINSTYGANTTQENLTVWPQNVVCDGACKNITDWVLNGTSITVLNMPFENTSSMDTQSAKDYSTFSNNGALDVYHTYSEDDGYRAWTTGQIGNALKFDGTDDYVSVTDSDTINITSNITVAAWVKDNGGTADASFNDIVDKRVYLSGGYTLLTYTASNTSYFYIYNSSGSACSTNTAIGINKWVHVTGVYNGSHTLLYVNGTEAATTACDADFVFAPSNNNMGIGVRGEDWGARFFNGTIDEVKIWNRSLSATEIANLYDNESAGQYDANMDTENLTLNIGLNETSGTTAADDSGNSNTGTLTNYKRPFWNNTGGFDSKGAFEFDGVDDCINIENNSNLDFGNGDFTVSLWVNIKEHRNTNRMISKYGDPASRGFIFFSNSGGAAYANVGGDIALATNIPFGAVSLNTWYLLTIVKQGNVKTTYRNEDLITIDNTNIGNTDTNSSILIGKYSTTYLNGTIDDVMIFNYSLTPEQIQNIYNNRFNILDANETSVGDNWSACVTLNDGTVDGFSNCSENITILAASNPSVSSLIPVNTSNYTTSQLIEIAATVTDDTEVSSVTANVSIPNGTIKVLTLSNAEGDKYNNSFSIQNVTGVYNVTFVALDNYNNLNQSEITTFNVNHTGPTVNLVSPENYTWTTDLTPTFQFNFTDDIASQAICEILVDGTVVATNSTTLNNTLTTLTASALTLGTHNWTVNCTDEEGGYNISAVNYTLDIVEAPTLTAQDNDTWIPASGTTNYTVNGTAFTFNFTSEMVAGADTSSASCELWFTNSSGNTINIGLNSTTLNGTSTTVYNNITLTEGQSQDWYINCSYNSTDIVSETRVLNVDPTAPNVYLEIGQTHDNYTWTTDTTPTLYYNFTDDTSPNASCEIFMDEVGRGVNSSVLNDTQTVWDNDTALSTGTYQWYVNCTDYMSNVGTSLSTSDSFVLEIISTNVNLVTPANNSWTSETRADNVSFIFNFNNGIADQASCELFITNASGNEIGNGVNSTTLNNTATTITNNNSLLGTLNPNGVKANWTVNCTFNGTTITAADYYSLNVDNQTPSKPTLSLSSSTTSSLTIAVSTSTDVVSCTTTTEGASISEVSNGNWQMVKGGLISGTSYSFQVTCSDQVNSRTSDVTQFTTASSGGGSGASGSGGGVSSGVLGQFEKKVWTSIKKGETAKMPVKNGVIGITEIEFKVKDTAYGVWLNVEKVDNLPKTVKTIPRKVYSNIKITENNVQKALEGKAMISFKVLKSWLTEHNLAQNNIALYHYQDDKWFELPTVLVSNDDTHIHYAAETEGFSYFVIGEKTPTAPVEETAAEEIAEVVELPGEIGEITEEKKPFIPWEKINWSWLVPIFTAIVGAVVLYLLLRKKK